MKGTREFIKKVERNGYKHVRTNGSHLIYQNDEGRTMAINIKLNAIVAKRLAKEYKLA